MIRALIVACAFTLAGAVPAQAQVGDTPAPRPKSCADCTKADADAAPIRKQIEARQAELRQLQQEQGINDANLNNLRRLRQDAVRRSDQDAAEQYEQSIDDLEKDRTANRQQQFDTQQEIERLNRELEAIGRTVDDCTKQCGAIDMKLPTGTVTSGGTEITVGGAPQPPRTVGVPPLRKPRCGNDCEKLGELERAHQELQQRAERANGRGSMEDLRDFEAQRRTVRELQRQVDECDRTCKPTTTSFLKPGVIGGVGGGVALIGLLAIGGGDSAPAIVSAPVATPNPAPAPVPSTTPDPPAPPVTPAIGSPNGTQQVATCVCEFNQADIDADVLFCQRVLQIIVASALSGAMRIAGVDPVLPAEGTYNTTTGAFDFSTTGHVGGVGTVTMRFTGTVDVNGNMTVTITYTRSGRTTIYRITTLRR